VSKIIQVDFSGQSFDFRDDGWFNATLAAERFGKEPFDWLNQRDTASIRRLVRDYIPAPQLSTLLDVTMERMQALARGAQA
jgi:hypothetical protein